MSIESRPVKGKEHLKKPPLEYRFRVYYSTIDGIRKQKNSKWFDSRQDAKNAEDQFIASHINSPTCDATFNYIALDWIAYCKDKNVPKVYSEKKRLVNDLFTPIFGKIKISDIKPLHIKQFMESDNMNFIIREYKTTGIKKTIYKPAYKNKIMVYLSSIFEHAITFYELPKNPCRKLPKFKESYDDMRDMVIYSKEEFTQFYNAIPEDKFVFATYFHTLYYTGLRKNECRSLRFCDMITKNAKQGLNIHHQLDHDNIHFTKLKTKASERFVQLDEVTYQKLMDLKEHYMTFAGFTDQWFIFGGTRAISYKTMDNIKDKAIKDSGMMYIKIHDLRHSHVSYLINNGANIVAVSKRIGHSNISMTLDTYTHLMQDTQDELVSILTK